MAASQGFLGYIKLGATASPTNKMAGVTDISTPFTAAMYDVTNMDAGTTNGWMQNLPGLKSGKLAIKVNYDPADTNGQVVAQNAWVNGTLLFFIVSENGTNTATFSGYVDNFTPHAPVNNKNDASYSVTITSSVVFA